MNVLRKKNIVFFEIYLYLIIYAMSIALIILYVPTINVNVEIIFNDIDKTFGYLFNLGIVADGGYYKNINNLPEKIKEISE